MTDHTQRHEEIHPAFEEKVRNAVHLSERQTLRSFIHGLEENYQSQQINHQPKVFSLRHLVAMAASVLLVASLYFIWQREAPLSPDELMAAYYEPMQNTYRPITRGAVSSTDHEMVALLAYNEEDYDLALKHFQLIPSDEIQADHHLFMGICHLEGGRFQQARSQFQAVIDGDDQAALAGQWYMALTWIGQGDKERATNYLKPLAELNDQSFYQRKATELLKKM